MRSTHSSNEKRARGPEGVHIGVGELVGIEAVDAHHGGIALRVVAQVHGSPEASIQERRVTLDELRVHRQHQAVEVLNPRDVIVLRRTGFDLEECDQRSAPRAHESRKKLVLSIGVDRVPANPFADLRECHRWLLAARAGDEELRDEARRALEAAGEGLALVHHVVAKRLPHPRRQRGRAELPAGCVGRGIDRMRRVHVQGRVHWGSLCFGKVDAGMTDVGARCDAELGGT
jgi:hypothetical protein